MVWKSLFSGVLLLGIGAGMGFSEYAPLAGGPGFENPEGLSPEEAMVLANSWGMNGEENKIISYVTSREIHFQFPEGAKTVLDLPPDRMLVAIAPYIRKTHDCGTHYPSSCRGELPDTDARVTVTGADGASLLEMETSTLANGFLELWLPRNEEVRVTIEARGLKASAQVSTGGESITCVTTLQLRQ